MKKNLKRTSSFLKKIFHNNLPQIGVIAGSGLGKPAEKVFAIEERISYSEVPGFPVSTVEGHLGWLSLCRVNNKRILLMAGRFHYYEGYSMREVTYPIRVLKELGCAVVILTNAAGGVNPSFSQGDIMLIDDHINLQPENPLRGEWDESLGPRFPSMHNAYDSELKNLALKISSQLKIQLVRGVYVALQGPSLETPAEYRFIRLIGGDAVGMSTAGETIVANQIGMKVLGLSLLTNIADPEHSFPVSHREILAVAEGKGLDLFKLIKDIITEVCLGGNNESNS